MNPHETLPVPERNGMPETVDGTEFIDESSAAKLVEQTPQQSAGAGAVNAAVVGGAQTHIQQLMTNPTPATQFTPSDPSLPMNADDVDLIEKEWVLRAKAIVAATIGDPHAQNIQINRMKADYIKKRYNKDIKVKDE